MWNNIKCIYAVAAVVQYTKNVACSIQQPQLQLKIEI